MSEARGSTRHSETRRRARRRGRQQELPFDRGRHGGKRAGAGRKPGPGRRRVPHGRRPRVEAQFPVHVTTRMVPGLRRLRTFKLVAVLRQGVLPRVSQGRVSHLPVLDPGQPHPHGLRGARARRRLARGVQGWAVRIAPRRSTGGWGAKGRCSPTAITRDTSRRPRQMRATLCYVLNNARRHGEQLERAVERRRSVLVGVVVRRLEGRQLAARPVATAGEDGRPRPAHGCSPPGGVAAGSSVSWRCPRATLTSDDAPALRPHPRGPPAARDPGCPRPAPRARTPRPAPRTRASRPSRGAERREGRAIAALRRGALSSPRSCR